MSSEPYFLQYQAWGGDLTPDGAAPPADDGSWSPSYPDEAPAEPGLPTLEYRDGDLSQPVAAPEDGSWAPSYPDEPPVEAQLEPLGHESHDNHVDDDASWLSQVPDLPHEADDAVYVAGWVWWDGTDAAAPVVDSQTPSSYPDEPPVAEGVLDEGWAQSDIHSGAAVIVDDGEAYFQNTDVDHLLAEPELPALGQKWVDASPAIVYTTLSQRRIYLDDQWGDIVEFEVNMRAVSGTAYARVVEAGTLLPVSGSEVQTSSATFVRVRSGNFKINLVDGNEYQVQFGTAVGDSGEALTADMLHQPA